MNLGEVLRTLRLANNKTLKELSAEVNLTIGYLSDLERGVKKNPTADVLEKLANYFNISVDYLLGKTNNMMPPELYADLKKFRKYLHSNLTVGNIRNNKKGIKEVFRFHFGDNKPSVEMAKIVLALNLKDQFSYEKAEAAIESNFSDTQLKQLIDEIYNEINSETKSEDSVSKIPVLGYISAGQPLLAEEHIIDHEMVPSNQVKGGEYFYLKVRGDSMINAGIHNGDLVLVRQQSDVENNEIAVVMVNGHDATVKRVHKCDGHIKLIPENDNYEPVEINNSAAKIIGKVTALTRKF